MTIDPLALAKEIEPKTTNGPLRKYYRLGRPGRWYGGIATADCVGCFLKCVFCWSGAPRDNPEKVGKFYSPSEVFAALDSCSRKHGYRLIRVSGNEPTLGRKHLLALLEIADQSNYSFILETNGILIGSDRSYARALSKFRKLHVRVSIKGTNQGEFSRLTGAAPEAFELQLKSIENLLDEGVPCHPAVMLSFSPKENFERLRSKLAEIDESLAREVEEEYVILYPNVVRRLENSGVKPLIAYRPSGVPSELI
ncbi:MAG: molybdenum cofactor biosynthesis protein MoaA [Hadesarchaea archaeon YNP_N21]|nr:MAG: molybdenum cofactor biosynthesis protein MoaA [Hadesarchaea archaeon YNP_N21]